jgi:hypothetical protein
LKIEPDPNLEEVAAIAAALRMFREEEPEDDSLLKRSRWRLAGLLGHAPPRGMKLDGALWSYSSWEGMV